MLKKGFTLIELLAVIIILAIIALIATPIILNVVEDARISAGKSEAQMIYSGINNYCASSMMEQELNGKVDICADGVTTEEVSQMVNLGNANILDVSYNGSSVTYLKVESNTHIYTLCSDGSFAIDNEKCETLTYQSHYVNYGGLYNDSFQHVISTSDGNYVALGTSDSPEINGLSNYNQEDISTDVVIVKFDKNGQIIWERKFGGTLTDFVDTIIEAEENGKKYYIVSCWSNSTDYDMSRPTDEKNEYRLSLLKYDENGNLVLKKIFIDDYSRVLDIKKIDGGYIAVGWYVYYKENGEIYSSSKNKDIYGYNEGLIMKLDEQFNVIWSNFFGGTKPDEFNSIIFDNDKYIVVGSTQSIDYDIADISKGNTNWVYDSIIVSYDENGNLIRKSAFGSSQNDSFNDVVKKDNEYFVVGYSQKNDIDLINDSNSGGIIVKYDKNLNYITHKVIGANSSDNIRDIILDDGNIIVLSNLINDNQYVDSGITVLDKNLNVLRETRFDGGNTDVFYSIDKASSGYIVSGYTYSKGSSINDYIDPYSKGNGDAILIKYDKSLNIDKSFNRTISEILIPKEVVKDYGTGIPSYENMDNLKLYTTNNPSEDIGNWCSTEHVLYGEKDNYKFVYCLKPFNRYDQINVIKYNNGSGVKLLNGLNDYKLNENIDKINLNDSWFRLYFMYNYDISNIKLIFNNNKYTIQECVDLGYIEPLVIYGNNQNVNSSANVINDTASAISGGKLSGLKGLPAYVYYYFKTKSFGFEGISFQSEDEPNEINHFTLTAYRNFDISLSKAE